MQKHFADRAWGNQGNARGNARPPRLETHPKAHRLKGNRPKVYPAAPGLCRPSGPEAFQKVPPPLSPLVCQAATPKPMVRRSTGTNQLATIGKFVQERW